MRVAVLGSGVIGTTIAWYAAKAGHEVTVVDRQSGPGLETSFANAGEVSPGYSAPWAGPGVPVKAIKWMLMRHSPLVIWPLLDPALWRFGASMLANCTERAYRLNKSRMVPIAEYSRDCLKALRAETGIAYDEREQGTLQLFRTQQAARRHRQGHRDPEGVRRAVRSARSRWLLPRRTCARAHAAEVRRSAAAARRRDRRLLPVHQPAGRDGPRDRRDISLRHAHRGDRGRRRADRRRPRRRRQAERRCLRLRARQLLDRLRWRRSASRYPSIR